MELNKKITPFQFFTLLFLSRVFAMVTYIAGINKNLSTTDEVIASVFTGLFLAVSAIAFAFTKRFFKDVVKVKKQPTNSDSLIGMDGIVTTEIDNLQGNGKVYISGLTWSAKSLNGEDIPEGAVVTARKIEGATLVVEIKELAKASEK